jgi:transposase
MDTAESAARVEEDQGNRPRRKYTIAEKKAIVEETRQPGARVSLVAKRHGVATSLIFGWRRLLRKGLLTEMAEPPPLLPVKVTTPTLVPSKRAKMSTSVGVPLDHGSIEVEFAEGHRLRTQGLDGPMLIALFTTLCGR